MDVNTFRKMLFFSTVRIKAGNATEEWTGTGFFFGETHAQIATNRHVLEGADWVEFTAIRRRPDGEGPEIGRGLAVRIEGPGVVDSWIGHPDPKVDVAIWATSHLFDRWVEMGDGQQPYYKIVRPVDFADMSSLDAIEDVTFVGYPNGFYDLANLTPIARHGRTATPPSLDYGGKPTFLIDAPVFGGSSGSPVYIVRDSLTKDSQGGTVLGAPKVLFVGIVAAVHVRPKVLEITDPAQQSIIGHTVLQQELGLGIVYKPATLLEIFDEARRLGRMPA